MVTVATLPTRCLARFQQLWLWPVFCEAAHVVYKSQAGLDMSDPKDWAAGQKWHKCHNVTSGNI